MIFTSTKFVFFEYLTSFGKLTVCAQFPLWGRNMEKNGCNPLELVRLCFSSCSRLQAEYIKGREERFFPPYLLYKRSQFRAQDGTQLKVALRHIWGNSILLTSSASQSTLLLCAVSYAETTAMLSIKAHMDQRNPDRSRSLQHEKRMLTYQERSLR